MIVFQFTSEVLKNAERAAKTDNTIVNILLFVSGVAAGILIMMIIEYVREHEL